MAKDRHTREYYIEYARKHPFWCKAPWYLSTKELIKLRKDSVILENKKQNNIYIKFDL